MWRLTGCGPFSMALFSMEIVLVFAHVAWAEEGKVSVMISPGSYSINETDQGDEVAIEGFGRWLVPGQPDLPARIFTIAIPPGAETTAVTVEAGERIALPGSLRISPVPPARLMNEEGPADRDEYDTNYDRIYGCDKPFPEGPGFFVGRAGYRKYNLVDVRVTPFSYYPQSGKLVYYPKVTIHISYQLSSPPCAATSLKDDMVRTEKIARDLILNYDEARAWYPDGDSTRNGGLYDLVIITLDTLIEAVQPLVDWETVKGRNVKVVTVDWIATSYSGYDLQEKMRNFLMEKYPSSEWGIQDVLLTGNFDDVPLRRCEQFWKHNPTYRPATDFYYAELSLPDSLSWDKDGDHLWAEDSDPIDFYAEVNVGRIPWSDASTVESICKKCAVYENHFDPGFKKNILLLGSFLWPEIDNAPLLEYKTEPVLHPWMADWTLTRMYEKNGTAYSAYDCDDQLVHMNVMETWLDDTFAVINIASHGSPLTLYGYGYDSSSFLNADDCRELNDNFPAVIFAAACSTSETDEPTCLGREMLKQGAVGYLGATKPPPGVSSWKHPDDGGCSSFDYFFTVRYTSAKDSLGGSQQWALRQMYTLGLWFDLRYETFVWGTLYGHPCVNLATEPIVKFSFPERLPEGQYPPGLEEKLCVRIENGRERFIPGTGFVYYRVNPDDPFTVEKLTAAGKDLYEAWLPQTRPGNRFEYYFSAEGDGGTRVTSPFHAPDRAYSFNVALIEVVMEEDFEHENGWSVQNYQISDGEWERGDPVGTFYGLDPVQPEHDHSPMGSKCYVTGKGGGAPDEDDVDGWITTLISPEFDIREKDDLIRLKYWFYHSESSKPNAMRFAIIDETSHIDLNVLEVHHSPQWNTLSFRPSEFLSLKEKVRVKVLVFDYVPDDIVEALIDDVQICRINENPSLWTDAYSIPENMEGVVNFYLDAGPSHGNRNYLILGSMSGTNPGIVLPGGTKTIPLEWDLFTHLVLYSLNSATYSNFLGFLDDHGRGTAQLATPAFPPGNPGIVLYFAFILTRPFDFVSNPVTIEIGGEN